MIKSYDLVNIGKDVDSIINDWNEPIEIWTLLSSDKQSTWDPILKEITGVPNYTKFTNIPCTRKDISSETFNANVAGDKIDGELIVSISKLYMDGHNIMGGLDEDTFVERSIAVVDGNEWTIKEMKHRFGEYILKLYKKV